jgi:hypothetical protein
MFKTYLWNIAVALDQFLNTALGGDPDMTLSGRMGRAIKQNKCYLCRAICLVLNKFEINHCIKQDINEQDEGRDEIWHL